MKIIQHKNLKLHKSYSVQKPSVDQIEATYAALRKSRGIAKDNVSDTSSKINEILYGENGAWRGVDKD